MLSVIELALGESVCDQQQQNTTMCIILGMYCDHIICFKRPIVVFV